MFNPKLISFQGDDTVQKNKQAFIPVFAEMTDACWKFSWVYVQSECTQISAQF